MDQIKDVIVIGGGQSALACGYFLRRAGLDYLLLDNQEKCGGAWLHVWNSLTLFSPAEHNFLPGWPMPKSENQFPTRDEVIDYLCQYEQRYQFPVERPIEVQSAKKTNGLFKIISDNGEYWARALISATGTFRKPYIPAIPGREKYKGTQLHSGEYKDPDIFQGQKVLIVGEGNSGAQILAEVSKVADTVWATANPPEFLPDDVDGRVLFDYATAKYHAQKAGRSYNPADYNLGNIVMVPPVIEARKRGVLKSKGSFDAMNETGVILTDGTHESFDAVVWCTGFGYATDHLQNLVTRDEKGKIATEGTKAKEIEGLWLVGYGGWTGFASATMIGVGRTAKQTVKEVEVFLKGS